MKAVAIETIIQRTGRIKRRAERSTALKEKQNKTKTKLAQMKHVNEKGLLSNSSKRQET